LGDSVKGEEGTLDVAALVLGAVAALGETTLWPLPVSDTTTTKRSSQGGSEPSGGKAKGETSRPLRMDRQDRGGGAQRALGPLHSKSQHQKI